MDWLDCLKFYRPVTRIAPSKNQSNFKNIIASLTNIRKILNVLQ